MGCLGFRVRELRGPGLGVLEVEGSGLSRIATSWPDELEK